MKKIIPKYIMYLIRWQLSTPPLAFFIWIFSDYNPWVGTIIANFVGGFFFFWIDRYIFTGHIFSEVWQVRETVPCVDCGTISSGYRLVFKKDKYDKTKDKHPEYRCESCSIIKNKDMSIP